MDAPGRTFSQARVGVAGAAAAGLVMGPAAKSTATTDPRITPPAATGGPRRRLRARTDRCTVCLRGRVWPNLRPGPILYCLNAGRVLGPGRGPGGRPELGPSSGP